MLRPTKGRPRSIAGAIILAMPETTVVRFAGTAPRVGDLYGFRDCGRTFAGTVILVKPMGKAKQHVSVTIELSEAEHRRLLLGGEVG
jgi:hypothetical protein